MPLQRYLQLFTEPPKTESDWRNVQKGIEGALKKNVQQVQQSVSASQYGSRESVYIGDAGIAFMELTLARLQQQLSDSQPDITDEQSPLSPSLLYSLSNRRLVSIVGNGTVALQSPRDGAHVSFLETSVGFATLTLSRYPLGRQRSLFNSQWRKCRDFMLQAVEVIERDDSEFEEDDGGCEVVYGRGGFLYALLYLRSAARRMKQSGISKNEDGSFEINQDLETCGGLLSDATMEIVIRSIIRRGRNGAKLYRLDFGGSESPPLMWHWHSRRYLGGAHGVVGILQMLLRCPFPLIEGYMPDIVQTIDWLVSCQDRGGNWPTRAPDPGQTTSGEHELVQWCHGAPAMLVLLSTILRMSVTPGVTTRLTERQQDRFVVSLQRGCALVYMRGILRKGVGLCDGVAGSVYALLSAADVLDDPCNVNTSPAHSSSPNLPGPQPSDHHGPYFTQAVHLAHLATYANILTRRGHMKTPDHPWSLYEVMAGMCCAWGEILFRMRNYGMSGCLLCSGMPGYDDIM